MKYNWILDVLADLESFAAANGLNDLSRQLDQTRTVAATDIASVAEVVEKTGDGATAGTYSRNLGASANA